MSEDQGHRRPIDEPGHLVIPGARAGDFMRWRDATCPHSTSELRPDLGRHVCLDCGILLGLATVG